MPIPKIRPVTMQYSVSVTALLFGTHSSISNAGSTVLFWTLSATGPSTPARTPRPPLQRAQSELIAYGDRGNILPLGGCAAVTSTASMPATYASAPDTPCPELAFPGLPGTCNSSLASSACLGPRFPSAPRTTDGLDGLKIPRGDDSGVRGLYMAGLGGGGVLGNSPGGWTNLGAICRSANVSLLGGKAWLSWEGTNSGSLTSCAWPSLLEVLPCHEAPSWNRLGV